MKSWLKAFLDRKIPFSDIPKSSEPHWRPIDLHAADPLESILEADAWAREHAVACDWRN